MAFSVSGWTGRTPIGRVLVAAAVLVVLGGRISEGGYLYETRPTLHGPNAARNRHVALRLGDGRVGLFAGFGRTDVEVFDPATESFLTTRATRAFNDLAGAILPDGNALLVDGQHDAVFDYLTEQYVDTDGAYPGGYVRFPAMVPLPDGKVFLCGGYDMDFRAKAACGIYDPRRRQFQALGDLAIRRALHTAVLIDDRYVLIAGGYGYHDGSSQLVALDSLEVYDTNAGRSGRIRTVLQQPRYSHGSVRLPDGRVLILGGIHSGMDYWLRSTEIFDPKTSAVAEGPAMGLGRNGMQLTVLPSGRIAVFGGNYDARTVEVYDPDTNVFELADSLLLDPRWTEFTATSLDAGGVLLVGGRVNDGPEVLRAAEIFEETETATPSAPAMTLESIRALLADPDADMVAAAVEWLTDLGPQARPILEMLAQDETPDLARQAADVLASIDARSYPEAWCVEVWDASGRLDTVWLDNFESPDHHSPANPHPNLTTVLRATDGVDFTHLVVRFPSHAPYEARVRLFNLIGWTRIPQVVLGEPLTADELARAVGSVTK